MKPCLADVNVLLALLVRHHVHHKVARKWFDGLAAGEAGLCRVVQLALIRLRSIIGEYAVPAGAAWRLIDELLEDERLDFAVEPKEFESVFPGLLTYRVPTRKLVGDASLAAFAIAAGRRLATLDRGFRQFKGLEVDLIGS